MPALLWALLAWCGSGRADWRFLDEYPAQYVAQALGPGQAITVDGKLDEPGWREVPWIDPMVDITRHQNEALDAVPNDLQARVKIRWDQDYFYVGAELNEPYVTGQLYQHNHVPPYHDNDFEIFIDPSGTSQYYIEYEMSLLNATYDIKWGKPDGTAMKCANLPPEWPALPTCVNTSFPGYFGNWTMATQYHPGLPPAVTNGTATEGTHGSTAADHAGDTGLLAATSWDPAAFDRYSYPHSVWSLEVRFPIRQTPGYSTRALGHGAHGGLLDADPVRQPVWDTYDPALGDAGPGRPRYWWVNFARAEHIRLFTMKDGSQAICPKNCTQAMEQAVNSTALQSSPWAKQTWPTFLGGGYWEWVWGPVGDARPGVGYMHRPSSFPLVQFAGTKGAPLCRNIEFPGRHVAKAIHLAQEQFFQLGNKTIYSSRIAPLVSETYCNQMLSTSDTCDLSAFSYAFKNPAIFTLGVEVISNISKLTRKCPNRPCYIASVRVAVPDSGGYRYVVRINSNRDTEVSHSPTNPVAPCL